MSLMMWLMLDADMTVERLGDIPSFLDADDPRSAREQLDAAYKFAGGWRKFEGFTYNHADGTLNYPDDPPVYPRAQVYVRNELVVVFQHDWVMIKQPDGTFEVARMD